MRRRHLKLLSLWILPLLVARMLIPAGFMLSVNAAGLSLMFCPSGVVQVGGAQHRTGQHPLGQDHAGQLHADQSHAGMDHAGMQHADANAHAEHEGAAHNQDNAPCPFSLVASATPGVVAALLDVTSLPGDERFDFISASISGVGPLRADRIRGPPAVA